MKDAIKLAFKIGIITAIVIATLVIISDHIAHKRGIHNSVFELEDRHYAR